jgi:hypothetical protein
MSDKNRLLDVIVDGILLLEDKGMLSVEDLIDRLGGFGATIIYVRRTKKIDYQKVAEYMEKVDFVFLPVGRKNASYAKAKLEEITGKTIVAEMARHVNEHGYLFGIKQVEEAGNGSKEE